LIVESIVCNNDNRIEPNDQTYLYEPKGSPVEVSLTQFLMDNEQDVHALFVNRNINQPK